MKTSVGIKFILLMTIDFVSSRKHLLDSPIVQLRHLSDNDNSNGQSSSNELNLGKYAMQFKKCQFRKQYVTECSSSNQNACFETQKFAVFRLCPLSSSSSPCSHCNSGFGEYMIDLEVFLKATTQYYYYVQQSYCEQCYADCQSETNANQEELNRKLAASTTTVDCSTCVTSCSKYDQLHKSSQYIDAINYVTCQYVYTDSSTGVDYYAGPVCASNGKKIKIGVFQDSQCSKSTTLDVESILSIATSQTNVKLTNIILRKVYTNSCIACANDLEQQENGGQAAEDGVCKNLYDYSAKCEKSNGFEFAKGDDYSNSYETSICSMISQLVSGAYDQSGEVILQKESGTSSSATRNKGTPHQKFALSLFMFSSIGLALYSFALHHKLTKGGNSLLNKKGEEQGGKQSESMKFSPSIGTLT